MADVTKKLDLKVGTPGAEKVPGVLDKIGHSLHEMNAEARRGAGHGIETILKGAGVAAVGHFISETVKEAAKSYVEMAAAGDRSYAKLISASLQAIPVVGSVVDAIDQIREAWRLATLSDEEYNDEIKRTHELIAEEATRTAAI